MYDRPDDLKAFLAKVKTLNPRAPNTKEKYELVQYVVNQGHDEEDAKLHLEGTAIAVFDNYMTGSPGYTGKVMMVIWDGAPSFYEVFVWNEGKMQKEECEFAPAA